MNEKISAVDVIESMTKKNQFYTFSKPKIILKINSQSEKMKKKNGKNSSIKSWRRKKNVAQYINAFDTYTKAAVYGCP